MSRYLLLYTSWVYLKQLRGHQMRYNNGFYAVIQMPLPTYSPLTPTSENSLRGGSSDSVCLAAALCGSLGGRSQAGVREMAELKALWLAKQRIHPWQAFTKPPLLRFSLARVDLQRSSHNRRRALMGSSSLYVWELCQEERLKKSHEGMKANSERRGVFFLPFFHGQKPS